MNDKSLSARYFDDVYLAHADPWAFETSAYEAAKYRTTIEALGKRRFGNVFEIGCSIGVLTEMLATLGDRVLAVDVSESPLVRARQRCANLRNVRFECMSVPVEFPDESFNLIVMSEVGYYWSRADLAVAAERIEASLAPGGAWLLVHWTPPVADYPLRGDEVHEFVLGRSSFTGAVRHISGLRRETYRLDLFEKKR